jgi:ribonucleoside-diphosphate reductase alpha chain
MCQKSGSGEPGFYWTDNEDWGSNPCVEIALQSNQFCNLTTSNLTNLKNKKDFLNRVYSAALIGTLQASYTEFDYLRPIWKKTTESEALLGVSFTGIADAANNGIVTPELLREGANLVLEVNQKYASKIGINPAARTTAIKPEGSSSCVLGSSSGVHARHADYYLRRIRMNNDDSLAVYLKSVIPDLVEQDLFSASGVVVTIPQKSPDFSITRQQETADSLLKRTLNYRKNWIEPGHRYGDNMHNVSVTISVKENEWDSLKESLWENRNSYSGISLLPFDGGTYKQAPFEDCTKEKYEELSLLVKEIDLRLVREENDNTKRIEQLACAGGQCEIT